MTRMIENTPMVMPIIVRDARNLFAPSELKAIFMISRNCMIKNWKHLSSKQTLLKSEARISNFHSYRSAVTGSNRDAVQAGANPEINPVIIDTTMLMTTNPVEHWIGKDGKEMPMRNHIAKANHSTIIPPSKQRA